MKKPSIEVQFLSKQHDSTQNALVNPIGLKATHENPYEISVTELKLLEFEEQIKGLQNQGLPISPQLRFAVFKLLLKENPDKPESVPSKIVRLIFEHDLAFAKKALEKWVNKKELAKKAIKHINDFFSEIPSESEMSFYEHSYYCFVLSAFMTGIDPEHLQTEYDKQIHTMVYGTVHPLGKWTIKTELENQNYAKFIFHVSDTGLAAIEDINDMSTFRIDKVSSFNGVRLIAVGCNEQLSFDGVHEMVVEDVKRDVRALEVVKHDFIHAAFLKRHFEKNPLDFWNRFNKAGEVYELIGEDNTLNEDPELKKLVQIAWFFWFHELTTSLYVDGIPETLPKRHKRIHGDYANEPQILLRLAEKLHLVKDLYRNELDIELSVFSYFGIKLKGLDENSGMTRHEKVKEMMTMLNRGYAYLDEHYSELYDIQYPSSWLSGFIKREFTSLKSSILPQPEMKIISATNLINDSADISEEDAKLVWNLLKRESDLAELFNKIQAMRTYGELLYNSDLHKGTAVKDLASKLTDQLVIFLAKSINKLPSAEEVDYFKSEFSNLVHSQDKVLISHREIWKPIVVNILIALTGIGLLALIVKAALQAIAQSKQNKQEVFFNDYFFFAKTSSQTFSERIEESLNLTPISNERFNGY